MAHQTSGYPSPVCELYERRVGTDAGGDLYQEADRTPNRFVDKRHHGTLFTVGAECERAAFAFAGTKRAVRNRFAWVGRVGSAASRWNESRIGVRPLLF